MPVENICENCSTSFKVKPSHSHQRFCSGTCKFAHEAEHGRPAAHKAPTEFNCAICSAPFGYKPAYLKEYRKKYGKDPLYCSLKCFGLSRRYSDDTVRGLCLQCGKPMPLRRRPGGTINQERGLCSTECRSLFRRLSYQAKNPNQQPTKRVARHGYIRMIVPGKNGEPSRDVLEHRHVMERRLGRLLHPDETVHHRDGNRTNNTDKNLELFSSRHGPGQRVTDKVQFAIEILALYPDFARQAGYVMRPVHISDEPVP